MVGSKKVQWKSDRNSARREEKEIKDEESKQTKEKGKGYNMQATELVF